MRRGLWWRDLTWAGFILTLAAAFGLLIHWELVRISLKGEMAAHLEKQRSQRRELKFQGVPTVSLAQAYARFQEGQSLFIDARPAGDYMELHIPGALNLPPENLGYAAQVLAGIAKERPIVAYCGEVSCDAALQVAEKLQSLGFTQVAAFLGGFRAWDEAGYPADSSK